LAASAAVTATPAARTAAATIAHLRLCIDGSFRVRV
jgi:hypothetical protein